MDSYQFEVVKEALNAQVRLLSRMVQLLEVQEKSEKKSKGKKQVETPAPSSELDEDIQEMEAE